eukprot:TRINITY_DN8812_c1_g1_i2.p1 TRINITY_DN8812_c1_g1~~TRINITY_DN8812_c1_g1_i2.p1  ORF type:complete len:731 (+),score=105.79 TRINITY_DN8812_c1_g1_i2:87-2195(+)
MSEACFGLAETVRLLQRRGVPWYRKPLNMGVEHMNVPKIQVTHYLLQVLGLGVMLYVMFTQSRFIELDEPHGFTRSQFYVPGDIQDWLNDNVQFCSEDLPEETRRRCPFKYCNPDYLKWYHSNGCPQEDRDLNGGECKTAKSCNLLIEEQLNVFDVVGPVAFVPTRIKETVYERDCAANESNDVCVLRKWKKGEKRTRFVAGVENATLVLEHSFIASRFKEDDPKNKNWAQSSFDMPGRLTRTLPDGSQKMLYEFQHRAALEEDATRYEIKSVKSDNIPVPLLLDALGVASLDEPSDAPDAAGATRRYDGMVVLVSIFYENLFSAIFPPQNPARYTYSMTRLPGLEFKAYRTIYTDWPRKQVVVHRSGIFLRLVQTGRIARFSLLALLTYLAAMLPVIRASRFICDALAAYILLCGAKGYERFPPGERRVRATEDFLQIGAEALPIDDKSDPFQPTPGPDEVCIDGTVFERISSLQAQLRQRNAQLDALAQEVGEIRAAASSASAPRTSPPSRSRGPQARPVPREWTEDADKIRREQTQQQQQQPLAGSRPQAAPAATLPAGGVSHRQTPNDGEQYELDMARAATHSDRSGLTRLSSGRRPGHQRLYSDDGQEPLSPTSPTGPASVSLSMSVGRPDDGRLTPLAGRGIRSRSLRHGGLSANTSVRTLRSPPSLHSSSRLSDRRSTHASGVVPPPPQQRTRIV